MAKYKYSFKVEENMAPAVGRNLPISTKQSIEICKFVRGKDLEKAKKMLQDVVKKKAAVPFTRFNTDVGHKTKIGPGRYPMKACTHVLTIIESAEANAQFKGLTTTSMVVRHVSAQRGAKTMRWGRRGRQAKNTTIEVVLEEEKETEEEKKEKAAKKERPKKTAAEKPKAEKKEAPKVEKETPKVEKKEEKPTPAAETPDTKKVEEKKEEVKEPKEEKAEQK